jgi:hypothetical protein
MHRLDMGMGYLTINETLYFSLMQRPKIYLVNIALKWYNPELIPVILLLCEPEVTYNLSLLKYLS